jgi:uncharacterized DUF497 family protein
MEFEFDMKKSKKNKEKDGIDLIEAQRIWEDAERIEIPARTEDEPRYFVIGRIENRYLSAIINLQRRQGTNHFGAEIADRGDRDI